MKSIIRTCFGVHRVLFAVLSLMLFTLIQPANAAPKNKYAVAVIVGNKAYQGRIPSVDFAHNDANAMRRYVEDVLGYDAENIIDLRDASKAKIETAFGNERSHEGKLWRYLDPRGRSDVVVFYSGHGVPGLKDKRGYLLPVDADPEAPEINGYPLDTLLANLAKLKTKSMTVFLDACFSGQSQMGNLVRSASGLTITPRMPKTLGGKMTVITASQGDQIASWDEKAGHGLFTKHLIDALYGAADGEDYGNGDKKITLAEVREYLDDNMTRAARRTYGRHQNAWIKGAGDLVLASVTDLQPLANRQIAIVKSTPAPAPKQAQQASVVQPQPVIPVPPGTKAPLSSETMLKNLSNRDICKWATGQNSSNAVWLKTTGSTRKYVIEAFARDLTLDDCNRELGYGGSTVATSESKPANYNSGSNRYEIKMDCGGGSWWNWTVDVNSGRFKNDGEKTSAKGDKYWWDVSGKLDPSNGLVLEGEVQFPGNGRVFKVFGKASKIGSDYAGAGGYDYPGGGYYNKKWSNCDLTATLK
jgi:hypothetical protein